jgi:hypothetical protein
MKILIKFAQARDLCHLCGANNQNGLGKIIWNILDPFVAFKSNSFVHFQSLLEGKHEMILMQWITYLNIGIDHLAFEC